MTDPSLTPPAAPSTSARATIIAIGGAQALFFVYTIYYIISHADPKGDGMELVAIGPMGFIFFALVLPALMMAFNKREALRIPAILCLIAIGANAIVWNQILSEFAQSAAR